jgi:hypothetical protein
MSDVKRTYFPGKFSQRFVRRNFYPGIGWIECRGQSRVTCKKQRIRSQQHLPDKRSAAVITFLYRKQDAGATGQDLNYRDTSLRVPVSLV